MAEYHLYYFSSAYLGSISYQFLTIENVFFFLFVSKLSILLTSFGPMALCSCSQKVASSFDLYSTNALD